MQEKPKFPLDGHCCLPCAKAATYWFENKTAHHFFSRARAMMLVLQPEPLGHPLTSTASSLGPGAHETHSFAGLGVNGYD